ncbi:MAG: glycosyltransferase [Sphingomicrobium sp.]
MRPPNKPRILFVINSLTGGGAERVMTTLLTHSEDRRDVYDISLAILDNEDIAYPLPDWLKVHRLDCSFSTFKSMVRLRSFVRSQGPDLTLSFLTRSNIANWFAQLGRRQPWIISERTNTASHLGKGMRARVTAGLVRLAYPRATRIIAVSQAIADHLAQDFGVPADRLRAIDNPVDLAKVRLDACEEPAFRLDQSYVIAVGRLSLVKNFDVLIRAFVQSEIPGKLLILGAGPERSSLETVARELGVADRVLMPGFASNPYALLKRASAFVLSSRHEGFPNALVEALALEVPVVATNCRSGPAEILLGHSAPDLTGVHVAGAGILVPVNDVGGLADGLRQVRENALRSKLIEAGTRRVQDYAPEAVVNRYWSIIDEALQAGAPGRRPETAPA